MCVDYHPADGETEPAARSILAAGIGGILFEDSIQMLARDARTGTPNIQAVRIGGLAILRPAFGMDDGGKPHGPPIPEERVPLDLDRSPLWREFTGIIGAVNQPLPDLARFQVQRAHLTIQIDGKRKVLAIDKGGD